LLHEARGEINGVLLDNGTVVRLPPPEAKKYAANLAIGQKLFARGFGVTSPLGTLVMARQIGADRTKLSDVRHAELAPARRDARSSRHGPDGHPPIRSSRQPLAALPQASHRGTVGLARRRAVHGLGVRMTLAIDDLEAYWERLAEAADAAGPSGKNCSCQARAAAGRGTWQPDRLAALVARRRRTAMNTEVVAGATALWRCSRGTCRSLAPAAIRWRNRRASTRRCATAR